MNVNRTTISTQAAHVRARVTMLIQASPKDVYAAFVEPAQLTQFWLSKASEPLRIGRPVRWSFMVEGAEIDTTATSMESGKKLAWDWSDGSKVLIELEALDGGTAVTLINDHFPQQGAERIDAALMGGRGVSRRSLP